MKEGELNPREEEYFEILEEIGRDPLEQAKQHMISVIAVDHQLVAAVEAKYGKEKAIEMHRKKWSYTLEDVWSEAMENLGITEVDDLDKLVRIRMYLNDQTPCPSKIVEEPGRATMLVLACPVIQVAREVFNEDLGSTYLEAAASTEEWLYGKMVELAGLEDRVSVKVDKFACMNEEDHVCRGTFMWQGEEKTESGKEMPGRGGGKFGDPRDFSLDEVLEYSMSVTDKSPKEQVLHSAKAQYAAVYLTWKCLKDEFGPEEAEDLYWECWKELLSQSYEKAKDKLGMDEPKTARDIGMLHREFFYDVPARYEVVKDAEDEWIAHIHWCPNPELGPADVHSERMKYYNAEYALSIRVNEFLIRLAGLEGEIEHEHPTTYCAHADEDYCIIST